MLLTTLKTEFFFKFQFLFLLNITPWCSEKLIRAPPRLSVVALEKVPMLVSLNQDCEGEMLPASFLHSSFLQAVNAVKLWPVNVQRVPQATEHFCPAKLQTRCDVSCSWRSVCRSFPLTPTSEFEWGPKAGCTIIHIGLHHLHTGRVYENRTKQKTKTKQTNKNQYL